MEISVTLLPDSEAPERESKALIEHAVQDSWVSKKLVDKINLELEERDENVVPPIWNGCELVPVGLIALDFRRNDVEKPRVFEGTFQVADDDRFAILLGEELLNEEPEIENPKRSIFLNLRKKETQGTLLFRFFHTIIILHNPDISSLYYFINRRKGGG